MINSYNNVSIVIPVYNGSNYIRDAITSALAQTYKNCETIVVDDGSTDETEAICLSYGDSIRYFRKENGGVSSALNLGIREMRGEYFTWLAHDDVFYPRKLELQMAALERHDDKTAIVHGNYDLLNVKYGTISHMRQDDSYSHEQLSNSVFPILNTCVHASTPLIHRNHFERVGLFDENLPLTQDYDFLFRAMRGQHSIFVSKPLLLSRLHSQSGKNTNNNYDSASAKQYEHFADSLLYEEVKGMFASPRAFYLRIAAMMNARGYIEGSKAMLTKITELPSECSSRKLTELLKSGSDGSSKKICIFGAGYHGKMLKFELKYRGIDVSAFLDNDEAKHNTTIDGIPCLSPLEFTDEKEKCLIIIAADVSDAIEKQLQELLFPFVTTKKKLDSGILETPPEMELSL